MESQSTEEAEAKPEGQRGRSTIDFPYFDLDNGVEIATVVRELGHTSCDPASLATKLNMAPDGGGFRMRLIAAKTFGLINYGRSVGGLVELTDLGQKITDPQTERTGRLESFMIVGLYKAMFDRLKGQVLPPPPAIERLMETLGVAPKQKDKARLVFMRSAKQAGLFELSAERMTVPANLSATPPLTPAPEKVAASPDTRYSVGGGASDHPFIQGLIGKLPPADSEWDLVSRAKWLTTAANIFDLMYQGGNELGIKVRLEGSTLSVSIGDPST